MFLVFSLVKISDLLIKNREHLKESYPMQGFLRAQNPKLS